MTKDKALHAFFSSFGIPAYVNTNVTNEQGEEDIIFPYLTYEYSASSFGDGEISLTVNLWYYTESEAIPNAKAQEMADVIGRGGKVIPCDGGAIWIKRGSPWCQSLRDDTDPVIKRRYINITAEYLTLN